MRGAQALSQNTEASCAYRRFMMNELALPRRQELPEEAFIPGQELTELQPHGFVSEHRLAIYSVSHAPASLRLNLFGCPEQPDPEGANLVAFADAILDLQDKRRRGVWGHDQVPLDDFGVFWPYCSLLQPNPMTGRRTPAEQKVYEASLVDLELWYAHQMTTVIILSTSVPLNQPGYASHGWQLFENGVARLLKTYRSDLWPPVIDVGDRLRTRHPPLSMDDFSLGLSASFLSLETDRPIVLRLYEHALLTAYGHAQALAFNKCRWGDVELRKLVCALPLCSRLRSLTLMDNVYGGKGLVTLCGAFVADAGRGAAVLPVLRDLNLSYNNLNDEEVSEGGAHPLQVLAWALSPVTASDVAAAEALMPNSLANVEKLAIDGNDLDQAGIDPLVEALNTSALPRLRTVFGVGGAAHGTEVTSLRQVKRMRDKLSSIDFSKSDATQHLGEVQRGIYGQALQDINRIEARLQQAQISLKLWRERQERPG
ncbi:hypothetical protein Ctob_014535 [Chrysochromulina tobinii]|uniref:Uncharacterized protein n=1 Tax=Chrysochromulina tobinii TaxID=1460289 RepID=A0A0M0JLF7_9EUKA|nr:hypothetical protein Ctob_014535 [Chrysochromulina tobinii]|eukprot:KOO27152.1 hypothetical protein Ctob_014535 [Chrysochromulina sp. CCMP291]